MFNIEKTTEYKTIEELSQMDFLSQRALETFISLTEQAYKQFWFGEVSPEIKIQALGTKALEIFTRSAQAQGFIKLVKPDHVELGVPEGYEVVWGQDGSATINKVVVPE